MKAINKDAYERRFLEQFKGAYPYFPDGKINKGIPGVEPDFIITNSVERIGIEMARLYRDDSSKRHLSIGAQYHYQKELVEKAARIFSKISNNRFRVFVSFNERSGLHPKTIYSVAGFLAKSIHEALLDKNSIGVNPVILYPSMLAPYQEVFQLVQVRDQSDFFDYRWTVQNCFYVEPLNETVLHELIAQKEAKRGKGCYSNSDKLWLLLYMVFNDHAMEQQIPENLASQICQHGFDKIIIFKTIENTCKVIYPDYMGAPPTIAQWGVK
jgi:hypothetical protein